MVFHQPNGRPIDPRADNREWTKLLTKAGIREARLHDGRHTTGTSSPRWRPSAVAMTIMGHSSYSQWLRYSRSVPEVTREATGRVGAALWGQTGER
jgi:integrase